MKRKEWRKCLGDQKDRAEGRQGSGMDRCGFGGAGDGRHCRAAGASSKKGKPVGVYIVLDRRET